MIRLTYIVRSTKGNTTEMIIAINPDEKFVVNGNDKAGFTISQGDGVIFLPPEVVEKLRDIPTKSGFFPNK